MFILVELEIKVESGIGVAHLESVDDEVIFKSENYEEVKDAFEKRLEETLKKGFFDKLVNKGEKYAMIWNGGSYYRQLMIRKI